MEKLIRVPDNGVIGLPMTPSYWVSDQPSYKQIMDITMSSGGGMGGRLWHEYVERRELPTNALVTVKNIDGAEYTINTNYVTKAENKVLVEAAYMSRNPNFPLGKYTLRLIADAGKTVRLHNGFVPGQDLGRGRYDG